MDLKNESMIHLKIGYVPQYINIEKNSPMSVYDLFAGYKQLPGFPKEKQEGKSYGRRKAVKHI